ncbi:MAG: hypothetical protein IE931_05655 [Sphingobacteriales bacterium]|nr:hypothetical protein [Sphingobacteriales bacterium]
MANLKDLRNKSIFEDYTELFYTKMMREEVIFKQLGEKYFLEPSTIYRIILEKTKQLDQQQPQLPFNHE